MWKKIWEWPDFSPFVVYLLFSFWILKGFLSLLMKCFHTAFLFTHYFHLLILLGYRRISLVFTLNNWLGLHQIQCTVHYLHCVFKFDDYFFSIESKLDLVMKCPLKYHWEYLLQFSEVVTCLLPTTKGKQFLRMVASLKLLNLFVSSFLVSDCLFWRKGLYLSITDITDRFPRPRGKEKIYISCSFILLHWGNSNGTRATKRWLYTKEVSCFVKWSVFSPTIPCASTMS